MAFPRGPVDPFGTTPPSSTPSPSISDKDFVEKELKKRQDMLLKLKLIAPAMYDVSDASKKRDLEVNYSNSTFNLPKSIEEEIAKLPAPEKTDLQKTIQIMHVKTLNGASEPDKEWKIFIKNKQDKIEEEQKKLDELVNKRNDDKEFQEWKIEFDAWKDKDKTTSPKVFQDALTEKIKTLKTEDEKKLEKDIETLKKNQADFSEILKKYYEELKKTIEENNKQVKYELLEFELRHLQLGLERTQTFRVSGEPEQLPSEGVEAKQLGVLGEVSQEFFDKLDKGYNSFRVQGIDKLNILVKRDQGGKCVFYPDWNKGLFQFEVNSPSKKFDLGHQMACRAALEAGKGTKNFLTVFVQDPTQIETLAQVRNLRRQLEIARAEEYRFKIEQKRSEKIQKVKQKITDQVMEKEYENILSTLDPSLTPAKKQLKLQEMIHDKIQQEFQFWQRPWEEVQILIKEREKEKYLISHPGSLEKDFEAEFEKEKKINEEKFKTEYLKTKPKPLEEEEAKKWDAEFKAAWEGQEKEEWKNNNINTVEAQLVAQANSPISKEDKELKIESQLDVDLYNRLTALKEKEENKLVDFVKNKELIAEIKALQEAHLHPNVNDAKSWKDSLDLEQSKLNKAKDTLTSTASIQGTGAAASKVDGGGALDIAQNASVVVAATKATELAGELTDLLAEKSSLRKNKVSDDGIEVKVSDDDIEAKVSAKIILAIESLSKAIDKEKDSIDDSLINAMKKLNEQWDRSKTEIGEHRGPVVILLTKFNDLIKPEVPSPRGPSLGSTG